MYMCHENLVRFHMNTSQMSAIYYSEKNKYNVLLVK